MCLDWDPFPTPHLTWWRDRVLWRESIRLGSASGTQSIRLAFRHLLDLPKGLVPCSLAISFPLMMTHS